MITYLEVDDVVAAAMAALGRADVRDPGLLAAAVHRPRTVVAGEDAFPGLHRKAAALFDALVRYHPLIEGDKALAWVATRLFYVLNGVDLRAPTVTAGERLVLSVISGELGLEGLAETLADWSAPAR